MCIWASAYLLYYNHCHFIAYTCCWRYSLTIPFNSVTHSLHTPATTDKNYADILHSSHFAAAGITHTHASLIDATTATIYVVMSLDLKRDLPRTRMWCADKRNWNMSSEDWKWILPFRIYPLYNVRRASARAIVNDLFGVFLLLYREQKWHVINYSITYIRYAITFIVRCGVDTQNWWNVIQYIVIIKGFEVFGPGVSESGNWFLYYAIHNSCISSSYLMYDDWKWWCDWNQDFHFEQ